jgi:hypothetical protein
MLAALAEDLLVSGGSYTNWRCLNVGGVDYAITNVNPGAHTVTITGDSLSGAQTAIWYPYRIAGLATSCRVFQDSGRALVSADGTECIGGGRRRDRMQGHGHGDGTDLLQWKINLGASGSSKIVGISYASPSGTVALQTDTFNGTPRVGLTTDPRATIVFRYYWLGILA